MMERLLARGEAIARAARGRAISEMEERAKGCARVSIEAENIVLSGRGLVKRWLSDPALRFLGSINR